MPDFIARDPSLRELEQIKLELIATKYREELDRNTWSRRWLIYLRIHLEAQRILHSRNYVSRAPSDPNAGSKAAGKTK